MEYLVVLIKATLFLIKDLTEINTYAEPGRKIITKVA